MQGWKLYQSNRVEALLEQLAGILSTPLSSPWEQEVILVQSRGMERWLTLRLAERFGIWANARFPFPNAFLQELVAAMLPETTESRSFDPDVMTWRISGMLSTFRGQEEYGPLLNYLGEEPNPLKEYQISSRLADMFDQYLFYRPGMIADWERGEGDGWQPRLWRELCRNNDGMHRAELRRRLISLMDSGAYGGEGLPERVTVFGITALPPFHLDILDHLSRLIPIHVFLMNPCREFWFDILPERTIVRKTLMGETEGDAEGLHYVQLNSLLASSGQMAKEFFHLMLDFDVEQAAYYVEPGQSTLLRQIQSDILALSDASRTPPRAVSAEDRSIRIHSCHSPTREVEVLHDNLRFLLEGDGTLEPEDILVMAPDIETYAGAVNAVFENERDGLPYNISDRSVMQESALIDAFFMLLSLSTERFRVLKVLDLLEAEPVRRKLGLRDEELSLLKEWVHKTRVRWGIDASHRAELGLPAEEQNTWRRGMSRLLLGYAMSSEVPFSDLLPCEGMEGSVTAVLGAFAPYMEELLSFGHSIRRDRSLREWGELLGGALSGFFDLGSSSERELRQLHAAVGGLAEMEEEADFHGSLPVEVVRAWLRRRLQRQLSSSAFLSGGITFCSMLPMRAVPFRVICLIGMNDGDYPRETPALDFDLIAQNPQLGDRSRRNDDRYLFLEALLSARQQLYISYVGQSIQDNKEIPPSVLVSELLDYVDEGYTLPSGRTAAEDLVSRHRLQAFHPVYFQPGSGFRSYSEENYAVCRKLLNPQAILPIHETEDLPESDEGFRVVALEDLVSFFQNPIRFLCRRRLGMYLRAPEEEPEEREPFQLEGLDRYDLQQTLVRRRLEGEDLQGYFPIARGGGMLPHGRAGVLEYRNALADAEEFTRRLEKEERGEVLEPLPIDREIGGFRLIGSIPTWEKAALAYRCATVKPVDVVSLWIRHLALNAAACPGYPRRSLFVGTDTTVELAPAEKAEEQLGVLLGCYRRGLRSFLRFFPASSMAYAERIAAGKAADAALQAARMVWANVRFPEMSDPYYRQFFWDGPPMDRDFEETAKAVCLPLLKHRRDRK